jgi:hypothetical protein
MTTKKSHAKNDVARRLAGIKHLFVAAESPKVAKTFAGPDGQGVPVVPEIDVLEEIGPFSQVTDGVENAIANAINAFGGYNEASFDGDVRGPAAEVYGDIRGLTNVALGLSPPSRAFYNKVLGGLVQVGHDGAPPVDAGPVPYAPLRVSVEEIEKQGIRRGSNGSNGSKPMPDSLALSPVASALAPLLKLQSRVMTTYVSKISDGASKVTSAIKPLVSEAKSALGSTTVLAIDPALKELVKNSNYSGDVDQDMAFIESTFSTIYSLLS